MHKSKGFKVKGYKKLRALAKRIHKVKGKIGLREAGLPIQLVGWSNWGFRRCRRDRDIDRDIDRERDINDRRCNIPVTSPLGPSLQQKLRGLALANTNVIVNVGNVSFIGRVISVDVNAFEVAVTNPLNSPFPVGSIVTVNIEQVNAFGVS